MNDYARLSALISSGEDDALATRALSKALGAEYETQEISKQGGGFREVQITPPSCGYVALGNEMLAIRALRQLTEDDFTIEVLGKRWVRVKTKRDTTEHHQFARAVWLAVVECLRERAA